MHFSWQTFAGTLLYLSSTFEKYIVIYQKKHKILLFQTILKTAVVHIYHVGPPARVPMPLCPGCREVTGGFSCRNLSHPSTAQRQANDLRHSKFSLAAWILNGAMETRRKWLGSSVEAKASRSLSNVLPGRTSCDGGHGLRLGCPVWDSLATCGYLKRD